MVPPRPREVGTAVSYDVDELLFASARAGGDSIITPHIVENRESCKDSWTYDRPPVAP